MTVLAKGVDLQKQREFLRKQRCDGMQGFLFSPPFAEKGVFAFC